MARAAIAVAALLSVGSPGPALAAGQNSGSPSAASLDPTFGAGGRAFVPLEFEGPAKGNPKMGAATPDGGILLSNGHVLDRLDPSGQIDHSFGQGGIVTPPSPVNGSFEIAGIAVDSKGRIVVAGTSTLSPEQSPPTGSNFPNGPLAVRVERYLPDGSLDGSFGSNGIVETDLGLQPPRDQNGQQILERPWVQATGVVIDAQNRIVITGGASAGFVFGCVHDSFFNTLTYAGLVARFTEAGSLDSSFGGGDGVSGGVNREENALAAELTADPVVTPGGMLTFKPGPVVCPRDEPRPGIAELNEAGEPQLGFGTGGRVPGAWDAAAPGGSIVTLNWRRRFPGPVQGEVKRLQPDGAPDPGFGQGGSAPLVVRGGDRTALSAVAVDSAGQVLVGGSIAPERKRAKHRKHAKPLQSWLLLERLTPSGQPDGAFGLGGRITPRFKSLMVGPPTLLIDQQGRALLVSRYRGRKGGVEGLVVVRLVSG